MNHIDATSRTSIHHVGDDSLTYANIIENMSPAIVNDVGGIDKLRRLRHKHKFLYRTCEGDHLTRLCSTTSLIPEVWGSPKGPLGSKASMVSPHPISPMIEKTIMSFQSSPDHTPVEGSVPPIPVIKHPLQPRNEEVVVPMKSLVHPTLHVINIHDHAPSE
jgi:hypothetical protein